ncbi:hypothetical protein [Cellulomonas sp. S1-8]|uniref:hypothetical protein n=1 Tax=Cellulomonas sp. S1-8 TaxID=2904790 RepID=UPI002243C826|nr:hypothetical protein [Cellulomonas sp. S1-8]UZN04165.1 EAL domain-containing protein [Cellulomonas sp. S1-8]
MHGSDWEVASGALVAENLIASVIDPVTHRATAVSLSSECHRMRSEDAVVSVITLAYDTATTRALPGRARGLDVAERVLCRELDRWAGPSGNVVAIGEAAAAYLVMTTPEEARTIRAHLPELTTRVGHGAGPMPLVSAAQGASHDSSDVVARALERLVLPRGVLPVQNHLSSTAASRQTLWDAVTGARFGSQVRIHALGVDPLHAGRAEALLSLTRSPRYLDTAVAIHAAVPGMVGPDRDTGPVVWDASSVLSGTGIARPDLAQLLVDRCPPGVWIGVSSWMAALPEVMQALRTLRSRGHRVVLTAYGSGREPLAAFDELPVDAILLDPHLEQGAHLDIDDRVVHAAILAHAARNDVTVLTATRGGLDMNRRPLPAPRLRTTAPRGQLLERARLVGLTLRETVVLVNATLGHDPLAPRWDRYDVAMHWAQTA